MRWSLSIGRIAGIRVQLHFTFLLFIGWIAVTRGLFTREPARALAEVVLLLLIFGCVLLHEFGHALAARRYGIPTRDITLLPIGGVARLERMPEQPSQELVVAVAGPLVNVAIAVALLLAGLVTHALSDSLGAMILRGGVLETLLIVNVVMIAFNMIPAFPMDGGRVLRAVLALRMPHARATRIASSVGQGIAVLFAIVGLFGIPGLLGPNVMLVFIALFVFLAASEEQVQSQTRTVMHGLPVRAAMLTEFHALDARDPLRRAVDHLMAGSQQDFPVLDGGAAIGVLSRSDLVAALQNRGAEVAVGSVLDPDAAHVRPDDPLEEALQSLRGSGRSAVPVVHEGRLVGLLTIENVGDLLLVRQALRRFASQS
jgi:Zn-dependent protease